MKATMRIGNAETFDPAMGKGVDHSHEVNSSKFDVNIRGDELAILVASSRPYPGDRKYETIQHLALFLDSNDLQKILDAAIRAKLGPVGKAC